MRKKLIFVLIFYVIFLAWLVLAQESHSQAEVEVLGPVIVRINSPVNSSFYKSLSILLNISTSEKVALLDYSLNSGKYNRLCGNCNGFAGFKRFEEGENELIVRATTYSGRFYFNYAFFKVDSKAPVIYETYPFKKTNGTFGVRYSEDNLIRVVLFYGPNLNYSSEFNCLSGQNTWCFGYVNVSAWQGKKINYKFVLEDIFRSKDSKVKNVIVDLSSSESLSFWNKILAFFGL